MPVVMCLSERSSHVCLSRKLYRYLVVVLKLIHAHKPTFPTSVVFLLIDDKLLIALATCLSSF